MAAIATVSFCNDTHTMFKRNIQVVKLQLMYLLTTILAIHGVKLVRKWIIQTYEYVIMLITTHQI